MPIVRMERSSEMVLIREGRDACGRTDEQAYAMERNNPKPPRLEGKDELYARQIAQECVNYPKVMFKLAVKFKKDKEGKPILDEPIYKGDRINPNYPMPYNLAIENGYQGQVTGHGSDKGINIVHPYVTCFVPIGWNQNFPVQIDEAACKKDQLKLEKEGWVDHPNKLEIPMRVTEEA